MAVLGWLVHWSLRNRPLVLALTVLFVVFSARAALELPLDAVPDVTNIQVQVITAAPALSPVEVEQYITVPVERAMAGIPRTTEVRSISKYGLSVVTIVFNDGTDIYFARQLVAERMNEARDAVSERYGKVTMGPISSALGEVYQFVVRNDAMSLMQLEELLDWQIAPVLRTVPGIVEVNSFGGEDRQYEVLLDPARLQAASLSVADVANALERSNANAGGGYLELGDEQIVIGTQGLVRGLEDLERVVVGATLHGVPITIATVGEVRFSPRLRRAAASMNGAGEVVIGVALMLLDGNSRTVTEAVKAKLALLQPSLPRGTRIEAFYDRSALVERTVSTVARNLCEGALLVIAVLFLVLGDLRAGLVVATVIPLALMFAIVVMRVAGISGNLMSLGAIDFGLIVDGAVIIVENTVRRLSERRTMLGRDLSANERLAVVEDATVEVRSASVFGELIIALVYVPVLTLTGIEGKLFLPMASTVMFALAGAFVLSLTVVPVLASYVVRPHQHTSEGWLMRYATRLHAPLLARALRRRAVTLSIAVVALGLAVVGFMHLGAELVPQLDEGDLLVEARRLPGISLTQSIATSTRLEAALRRVPEISGVVSRTGAPEVATDPMGIEQSDLYLQLLPRSEWRAGVTKDDVIAAIEHALESVPEIAGAVTQPIQMRTNELLAGIRSDIAAILYGPDLDILARLGDQVAATLADVPGAVDVRAEHTLGLKYLHIVPEREKLARYGLSVNDVNQVTETIAVGHMVGEVLEGERRFGIVVRTRHGFDGDLAVLAALPLRSVTGQVVPLGDVARLTISSGPSAVNRSQQSRRLTVELNARGRDLLSVIKDARERIARQIVLPPGYRIEWGGQFESYERGRARLLLVVPIALALIVMMLYLAFHSMRAALVVLATVPCAVVGGVVALAVRSIPFSISAGIGFIALFGVSVLNGLVLVAFARDLEAAGATHQEAIERAAATRLRPVLMTALVAALGFLPMALGTAPGSEVQRPLATVVIGGIISATLLTLVVLPALYSMVHARSKSSIRDSPP